MAITPKNNDPKEPKLCDFFYISMKNPPIPFRGLKMAKKGVFIHYRIFVVGGSYFQIMKIGFLAFLETITPTIVSH